MVIDERKWGGCQDLEAPESAGWSGVPDEELHRIARRRFRKNPNATKADLADVLSEGEARGWPAGWPAGWWTVCDLSI